MESWNKVPPHLQQLMRVCFDSSHYYRQHWYWNGESYLRIFKDKMKLTTIPDAEWATVQTEAEKFWDEVAAESELKAKVVGIIKKYNETMVKAGPPYRFG
jgi:TRAP-type mannitol/chloroaromatic compound transport system substrate-binding protein